MEGSSSGDVIQVSFCASSQFEELNDTYVGPIRRLLVFECVSCSWG